jgi:histidinol dehydrogenase
LVYNYPADKDKIEQILSARNCIFDRSLFAHVQEIFNEVESKGDIAIKRYTKECDDSELGSVVLSRGYIESCVESIDNDLKAAIKKSIGNIKQVNELLMPERHWEKTIRSGTVVGEQVSPLDTVGLWVPSRKAPLISSALMLVTAAKVAGVPNIIMALPPYKDGRAHPATVAAGHLAGADQIIVGNGVSIIAGLCLGTGSIKKADAIYGPGPGAITVSMAVAFSYGTRTQFGLGPTDSAIYADDTACADLIAKDMLTEGEHGNDSASILVTTSHDLANSVKLKIENILKSDIKRKEILQHVFGKTGLGMIVVADNEDQAMGFVNFFAPEHILINVKEEDEQRLISKVINAGEILVGPYTPFSAANYSIGITAVLPTNGFAKRYSGITSRDMIKYSTIGKLSKEALAELHPHICAIGKHEELPNHVGCSQYRIDNDI